MPDSATMLDRYFDYAATAPPFPEALAAQLDAAARWFGNPSSAHQPGRAAQAELRRLKSALADMCGFADGRTVLASGATEANNWVIQGVLTRQPQARVLVAVDVHASVWEACCRQRERMDVLGLDATGCITLSALAQALRPETRLFCCSHAANETGVLHDVAALAGLCERRGVRCLVDGAQALGHVPVDLGRVPCDYYTFTAHKFGGPRGCGGVFLRGDALPSLFGGGPQEWGLRPGTENLPGLAGAVAALRLARDGLDAEAPRLRHLAELVVAALRAAGLEHAVNGDPATGLPGLLSVSFPGADGHALAADLALQGFAAAYGSACHADQPQPSRAILALGRTADTALGTLRISFGRASREEAVRQFALALVRTVARQGRQNH